MLVDSLIINFLILGYLLGAIPFGWLLGKIKNVDVFSEGDGLPGAANILRILGPTEAFTVYALDTAKGLVAIYIASANGIIDLQLVMVASVTILGHWNSIFTKFRGGDGVAVLLGITVALIPTLGFISVSIGVAVAAISRKTGHHAALWGGITCYGFLLLGSYFINSNPPTIYGIMCLAALVLSHSLYGHMKRRSKMVY
jgi:glycerol-3-phosphate acyltransferase PlsY